MTPVSLQLEHRSYDTAQQGRIQGCPSCGIFPNDDDNCVIGQRRSTINGSGILDIFYKCEILLFLRKPCRRAISEIFFYLNVLNMNQVSVFSGFFKISSEVIFECNNGVNIAIFLECSSYDTVQQWRIQGQRVSRHSLYFGLILFS